MTPTPQTAAAIHVLRHLDDATGGEVLKLSLKELVLRRVWRIERRERAGLLAFRSELALARGTAAAPAQTPIMQLDAALGAAVGPETVLLKRAVRRVVKQRSGRGDALRELTRDDLARQGLVTFERRRMLGLVPRTRMVRTAEGERLAEASWAEEDVLRAALGDPARAGEAAASAGALLLLVGPGAIDELDAELLRERAAGPAAGDGGAGASISDDDDLAVLDAFDPGIDAAVDSGGGGGDGGGGGGDGGGGDGGGG